MADGPSHMLPRASKPCSKNPCVGGSIQPQATTNIVHATPTDASGRYCYRERGPRIRSISCQMLIPTARIRYAFQFLRGTTTSTYARRPLAHPQCKPLGNSLAYAYAYASWRPPRSNTRCSVHHRIRRLSSRRQGSRETCDSEIVVPKTHRQSTRKYVTISKKQDARYSLLN